MYSKWGFKSTFDRGTYTWLVHWTRCAGTRDFCTILAALVGPVLFFLASHFFSGFVSIAQQARQAVVSVSGGGKGGAESGLSLKTPSTTAQLQNYGNNYLIDVQK
jgi:hypothetical protein